MRIHHQPGSRVSRRSDRFQILAAVCLLAAAASGCAADSTVLHPSQWPLFKAAPTPPGPAESLELHGDKLEPTKALADGPGAAELGAGLELYRHDDFSKAEKLFTRVADNTKNPEVVAEEARFYQGECLYRQKRYPKASDIYNKLLTDFPSGAHRTQAMKRMFDISNYWLDDTREEMRLERAQHDGKRWFVWPSSIVHFEKAKPFLDEEGRAMEGLERVVYNDITGPLADEALFLSGSVKFYHQDYREADHFFSQLVEIHPNSKYAPRATEYAIIAKHKSTGGADYDGRKAAEARLLVYRAQSQYKELATEKADFLEAEMRDINALQAEKDFKVADFYRRTGHPGAAYFCYEIVRRRYPGSMFAQQATARMQELDSKLEKSRSNETAAPAPQAETAPMPKALGPESPSKPPEMAPAPTPVPANLPNLR